MEYLAIIAVIVIAMSIAIGSSNNKKKDQLILTNLLS